MSLVIVTPVKNLIINNRVNYFERLTNSIHQQTYKDITHLLIAGPSADDTKAYIEKYAKKYPNVKISCQETKNKWHAMNLGLKEAKGDYIQFLEDDEFRLMLKEFEYELEKLSGRINSIPVEKILDTMGVPKNYMDIIDM